MNGEQTLIVLMVFGGFLVPATLFRVDFTAGFLVFDPATVVFGLAFGLAFGLGFGIADFVRTAALVLGFFAAARFVHVCFCRSVKLSQILAAASPQTLQDYIPN